MGRKSANFLLGALAAAVLLAGCGGGGKTAAKDSNHNGRLDLIKVATNVDPGDLSPWNSKANNKKTITILIYDTLFDYVGGEYVPVIAKGYTKIDDLHWNVSIFDYVKDSKGNHITADDVVAAYNRYVKSGFAFRFNLFGGIEKVDEYTVAFTFTAPPTTVAALEEVFCNVQIYSDKAFTSGKFAVAPVGTGPYTLKSYITGSKVILEANDKYWQKEASLISPLKARNVDTIEVDVVAEASQNVIGLQTGALDFSMYVPSDDIGKFQEGGTYADKFNAASLEVNEGYFITCNCSQGALTADQNLRRAIFYAIDNEAIVKAVGGGMLPCKAYGASCTVDYVADWEKQETFFNTYDPELARNYLAKSSYNGKELVMLGFNSEIQKTMMSVIQDYLAKIGIKVKIVAMESAQVISNATDPKAWDIYLVAYGGNLTINSFNKMCNNGEYKGKYSLGFVVDGKLQSLFDAANQDATWNDESMTDLFEYVADKAYFYTLVFNDFNFVYSKKCTELYRWNIYVLPNCCTYDVGK